MALPNVDRAADWLHPKHIDQVVEHLRTFAQDEEGIDLDALASAPYEVLEQHPTLTIEHSDEPHGGCAVSGYYQPIPPTIHVIRASTYGRDNFTLLHEYTHHLQQHDPEWADIEWRIKPEPLRLRIAEAVANNFASAALIPEYLLNGVSTVPTAAQIAELHQSVHASRQAAIVRITRAAAHACAAAGTIEHFFVSLAAADGTIVFSQMVGDDLYPPPRGSHQPDVQRLFETAVNTHGNATQVTSDGITYTSSANRSDIRLDLHLAHDGDYAFVVGTKQHRYGTAQWTKQTHLCPSDACDTEFVLDATIVRCPTCGGPRCPECRSCDCIGAAAATCTRCFMTLSAADISAGRSDHDECPW